VGEWVLCVQCILCTSQELAARAQLLAAPALQHARLQPNSNLRMAPLCCLHVVLHAVALMAQARLRAPRRAIGGGFPCRQGVRTRPGRPQNPQSTEGERAEGRCAPLSLGPPPPQNPEPRAQDTE